MSTVALIVLVVIIVGAVIVARDVRARRARRSSTNAWVAHRGWHRTDRDRTVAGLACTPVERGGRPHAVIRGADAVGRPVCAYEWVAQVDAVFGRSGGHDDGTFQLRSTVVASTVPGAHPMLQVSTGDHYSVRGRKPRPDPRRVITGVPEFDARFVVIADNNAHAASVVDPSVLRWLAADARSSAVGFRLHGSWLVCWTDEPTDGPRLDLVLGYLDDVRERIARNAAPPARMLEGATHQDRAARDRVPEDAVPQHAVPQDAVPQDAVPQDRVGS